MFTDLYGSGMASRLVFYNGKRWLVVRNSKGRHFTSVWPTDSRRWSQIYGEPMRRVKLGLN